MKNFLSILVILVILLNVNSVSASSWFYPDWPYRQMISITNNASTPEDYQVKLIFNISTIDYSKTKDDGSDLRFTYYNSETGEEEKVSYWIETWNGTGESIVWIKAPKIDGIYYIYYGNEEAETESSGEDVFEFFDDFEEGNLNKWKYIDGTWDVYLFRDNMVLRGFGSKYDRLDLRTDYKCFDCVIDTKFMLVEENETAAYLTARGDDEMLNHYASFYYGGEPELPTQYHQLQKVRLDKTPEVLTSSAARTKVGKWYHISLLLNKTFIKSTIDGGGLHDSIQTTDDAYLSGYVGAEMWDGGHNHKVYFDNYTVRKYSFPEPVYVIGEIEVREPPELIDTDVKNMYGGSVHDILREFFTSRYIDVLITAWVSRDYLIDSVRAHFSSKGGILIPNSTSMGRMEEGKYSGRYGVVSTVEVAQRAAGFMVSYLTSGTELTLFGFEPDILWDYVTVDDIFGFSRAYTVGRKLPSIFEGLPNKFLGDVLVLESACPVDILVTDSEGKRTGALYENGKFIGIANEIEKSVYTGPLTEPEFVAIFDPKDREYRIEVFGNGTGLYNFSIIRAENGSVFYEKNYTNIPITQGETHTYKEPVVDIEPPEAIIDYDQVSGELVVRGKDNFDKNVSVTYEEICSRYFLGFCVEKKRVYTLEDRAGNRLVLRMVYGKVFHSRRKRTFSSTHIRLLDAEYTGGQENGKVKYERNWLNYNFYKKSGAVMRFSQNIYVEGKGFIRLFYSSWKNKTHLVGNFGGERMREEFDGLHIQKIITDSEKGVEVV